MQIPIRRRAGFARRALLSLSAAGSLGCDSRQAPPPVPRGSVDARPYVTRALAAALEPGGRFEAETPPALPHAQITAAQARLIGAAAARTFGPGIRTYLEKRRGTPIDFAALEPGRAFYGHSPYEQSLPADVHPGFRKAAGPYYLVTLLEDGVPAMSVAVSAYNTDVRVENGRVTYLPPRHGEDFRMRGIPASEPGEAPIAPEQAAKVAASVSGALVAEAPRLELPGIPHGLPQAGRWRVRLDRKVRATHAGDGEYETDVVFVGTGGRAMHGAASPVPADRFFDTGLNKWVEFRYRAMTATTFSDFTPSGRR